MSREDLASCWRLARPPTSQNVRGLRLDGDGAASLSDRRPSSAGQMGKTRKQYCRSADTHVHCVLLNITIIRQCNANINYYICSYMYMCGCLTRITQVTDHIFSMKAGAAIESSRGTHPFPPAHDLHHRISSEDSAPLILGTKRARPSSHSVAIAIIILVGGKGIILLENVALNEFSPNVRLLRDLLRLLL